ncbi:MAG: hypothetical protein O2822_08705 [Chloroflexi bacterium]|nr:hypothetical protein [Chloroflexota bacterium]
MRDYYTRVLKAAFAHYIDRQDRVLNVLFVVAILLALFNQPLAERLLSLQGFDLRLALLIAIIQFLWNLLRANHDQVRLLHDAVREAEGQLVPVLETACVVERDRYGGRKAHARLRVRNTSGGQIVNAYARVARVVEYWHASINGERSDFVREMYENRDVFLRWEAGEARTFSFHREATLLIATGEEGTAVYALDVHGEPLFPRLSTGGNRYEITVEISADNVPTLTETFSLTMEDVRTVDADGQITYYMGMPYEVTFAKLDTREPVNSTP